MYHLDFELYQLTMATIRARKRTDGSTSYTAQIRLIREGAQVYQESQIFARKQAAQARRHRAGQSRWGDGQGNDRPGCA